tara:strand:+ start:391 stop:1224 length:834 start_codon:yes stop_codon:yes gene_type:complete
MSINYLEYDNLFDLACDVNSQYYYVYDRLYDAANKIFSTSDGVRTVAPPPHNLMQSLVASLYLYTDFYIDSITIDSASDQKKLTDSDNLADEGGTLYTILVREPGAWVIELGEIMKVAGDPQQTNEQCRQFFIKLTNLPGGIGIFNHIVDCYFNGLAHYEIEWRPGGRPVEVFSITEKKAFAKKCTTHLYNLINATTGSVPAAMPVQAHGLTTGPAGMDIEGGNTGKLKKIKKIKKTKKKNKKLKNIKKSKKHNKTRKKKTHKKHNKRRNKKTHKKN